mmetsp:Transcript_3923/g.5870  ORF Transcript_3923/g.5870 Transcript_3923/m.5870 type:complete len:163 (+) Transcript_3923:3-491(+)
MHGASPFEMEFSRNHDDDTSNSDGGGDDRQYGLVRIVECTQLKILGEVPFPPWTAAIVGSSSSGERLGKNNHSGNGGVKDGRNGKYPLSVYRFVRSMVHHDRNTRPNIYDVAESFGKLHLELVGRRWISYDERRQRLGSGSAGTSRGSYDDFDSLIASRDFV